VVNRILWCRLISQELFDRVQEILEGRTPTATPKRKINPDFPLKCFVCCESCGKPLTGGFCKGKTKTYRRYWCYREGCRAVGLLADELEAEFVHLLESLLPAPGDDREMSRADRDAWVDQQGDVAKETRRLQTTLEELKGEKRKILKLLMDGRISDLTYTESESEYSDSIRSAEQELRSLQSSGGDQEAFLKFATEFRSVNMATAWQMATPDQKKRVQTFLFEGGLSYSQKTKSLNPPNQSLFSALGVLSGSESSLASQNISSLNFFAGHMTNATGLRAEIVLINKDLLVKPTNHGNRVGGSQMKKGPWLLKRA
jgi:site-specific DNA recombinase